MNKEDIEIRAARAQQLLDDETFQQAMMAVTTDAFNTLAMASLKDTEACVAAVARYQAVISIDAQLRSYVTSGKQVERKPVRVA